MPLYRTQEALNTQLRDELVNILSRELESDAGTGPQGKAVVPLDEALKKVGEAQGRPVIFERAIPGTDGFHVIVLWDRWEDLPKAERDFIIYDAYERSAPDIASKLTFVMGVTYDEASAVNLLPYHVIPLRKGSDAVTPAQVREAMLAEGAIQTPSGLKLWFPTRDLAQGALQRLSKRVPSACWTLEELIER